MTDNETVIAVNLKLADLGKYLDGRPLYRIVWSSGQLEKRMGDFEDYYGHILIRRTYKAVREVPKYSYCMDRWILEKLVFLDPEHQTIRFELITRKVYDYEPIFVFQKSNGDPLPVTWISVDWIIDSLNNRRPTWIKKESEYDSDDRASEQSEIDELALELEDHGRSDLFAFEDSVFMDSTKQLSQGVVK